MGGQRSGSKQPTTLCGRSLASTRRQWHLHHHQYVCFSLNVLYIFNIHIIDSRLNRTQNSKILQTSPWMESRRLMSSMNILLCRLKGFVILLLGGGIIATHTLSCLLWPSTFLVHQVWGIICYCLSMLIYNVLATSTAVEHIFSQGRQLLLYTWNRLSPFSICAILCFRDWSHKDLVDMLDLVAAVNDKQKSKKRVFEETSSADEQ